jgi:ribosomal protein S18 acetylase RimI-like enzyme
MKNQLSEKFTSRMASMADLPRIHELETKKSQHYFGEEGFALERLTAEYQTPGFEPENSVRLIEDQDGNLVGLAEVWDERNPPVHPYVWLTVDPTLEDQGLEDYLMEWAEKRCLQVLDRVDPGLQVAMRSHSNHIVESSRNAKLALGMEYIRHSFRMRIDMEEPPIAPEWPEGIQLRPYNPERDSRRVYEVDDEVFRDHFGYVEEPPDEGYQKFLHHMTGDDSYDPSLWFLAYDGDELAGICLCRRYNPEDKDAGHVSSLGVRRPWRRRGLALALLRHSFSEFYTRGKTKVDLGVDAESLTGAIDLYKKAGMYVLRQYDMYEKVLQQGKDISVVSIETAGPSTE